MSKKSEYINNRVLFTFVSAFIIAVGSYFAIRFAKGQRPTTSGTVRQTGLLAANSFPTGAQVIINGKLTTATDDTLNLDPGEYEIEIQKDTYSSWHKTLRLQKELVTQTNALLFPSVPSLSPITFSGVQNVIPAPDGQKLVFFTSSASAEAKNGLYLADLTDSPLSLQRGPRQISTTSKKIDLNTASIIWSPDSSELMVTNGDNHLLLDITKLNTLDTMSDISLKAKTTMSSWEEEMYLKERVILAKFPDEVIQVATMSAKNVYFSPDQEKMLYTATASATLAEQLIPPPPATSTQPEERQLVPGHVYVYDQKEDKNFLVGIEDPLTALPQKHLLGTDLSTPALALASSPDSFQKLQASSSAQTADNFKAYHSGLFSGNLQWYPNSTHLIRMLPNRLSIVEYDGTNEVVVYSGPFAPNFVYPWSNGDKLLIMTSFSQPAASPLNLYAVQLK